VKPIIIVKEGSDGFFTAFYPSYALGGLMAASIAVAATLVKLL
jgi:hypothetical protein